MFEVSILATAEAEGALRAEGRAVAAVDGRRRAWFVRFAGQVFGPCRLAEVDAGLDALLVCWRGEGRWVFLRELLVPA